MNLRLGSFTRRLLACLHQLDHPRREALSHLESALGFKWTLSPPRGTSSQSKTRKWGTFAASCALRTSSRYGVPLFGGMARFITMGRFALPISLRVDSIQRTRFSP